MNIEIREAIESDIPQICALIHEFAEFEKLSEFCEVTEKRLQIALFGDGKVAKAIVAITDSQILAYAIFYPNFSTFRGQRGIFLEDIYVKPEMQGKNLGEKMLRHIAKFAKSQGFERIDFQVLEWNENAIKFYKKHGAVVDETERHFKFTDQAFQNLAS